MIAEAAHAEPFPRHQRRSIEELLREKHAKPIDDVRELAVDGVFGSLRVVRPAACHSRLSM